MHNDNGRTHCALPRTCPLYFHFSTFTNKWRGQPEKDFYYGKIFLLNLKSHSTFHLSIIRFLNLLLLLPLLGTLVSARRGTEGRVIRFHKIPFIDGYIISNVSQSVLLYSCHPSTHSVTHYASNPFCWTHPQVPDKRKVCVPSLTVFLRQNALVGWIYLHGHHIIAVIALLLQLCEELYRIIHDILGLLGQVRYRELEQHIPQAVGNLYPLVLPRRCRRHCCTTTPPLHLASQYCKVHLQPLHCSFRPSFLPLNY